MNNLSSQIEQLTSLLANSAQPVLSTSDRAFGQSLIAYYHKHGSLSPKQTPWIGKLIAKAHATPAQPVVAGVVTPEQLSGFDAVLKLFAAAKEHLKFPKITLKTPEGVIVKLSLGGVKTKYAGSVLVYGEGKYPYRTYYGQITPEGFWKPAGAASQLPGLTPLLVEFGANPTFVAKAHGVLTGLCCFCNKTLGLGEDKRSVTIGYGPVCAKHYGLYDAWKAAADAPQYVKPNLSVAKGWEDKITTQMADEESVVEVEENLQPSTTVSVTIQQLEAGYQELPEVLKKASDENAMAHTLGMDLSSSPDFGQVVITDDAGKVIKKIPKSQFVFTKEALEDIKKMAAESGLYKMDEMENEGPHVSQTPWKTGMINAPLNDLESYVLDATSLELNEKVQKEAAAKFSVSQQTIEDLGGQVLPQVLKQKYTDTFEPLCYLCDIAVATVLEHDFLICTLCAAQLKVPVPSEVL